MSWAEVRDGMKATMAGITSLVVHDVMPNTLPDKNTAVILPASDVFMEPAGHGLSDYVYIRVVVCCSRATNKDAQDALDAYIGRSGSDSIRAAVEAAPTLPVSAADKAEDCQFMRAQAYGKREEAASGGASAWQCDLIFRAKVSLT